MIIDGALYRRGHRESTVCDPADVEQAFASLEQGDFLWIGMADPQQAEMDRIGAALRLHPLAIEDAIEPHQRAKVEHYDDHTFVSIHAVQYSDDDITTHEVNMILGENYLLTVRHGGTSLAPARTAAEKLFGSITHGPTVGLYAVLDMVVDQYELVASELQTDVQEVEESVFSPARSSDSSRIYRLKRETLEFRRAVLPLREPAFRLATAPTSHKARPYFRDIADHLSRTAEAIDSIDRLLDNALAAHLAQLSVQQNEDMRKLTAGATIFAVPTAIAGIYGMNFEHMPELTWRFGYPICLAIIATLCGYIYYRFKRSGWL